jgi:hypothetical protein
MRLIEAHHCHRLRTRTYCDETYYYDFWALDERGIQFLAYPRSYAVSGSCSSCHEDIIEIHEDDWGREGYETQDVSASWELIEASPESVILRLML